MSKNLLALLTLPLFTLSLPAIAAQSLIPSPYPGQSSGAAPLNPSTPSTASSQGVMPSPYPQATGGSQGNPSDTRMGGGQQRVPSPFQRNYGVEKN